MLKVCVLEATPSRIERDLPVIPLSPVRCGRAGRATGVVALNRSAR
jgi:hypothetical protein